MDLSNYAVAAGLLTFFVIGAVELVKQLFARNWTAATIIVVSAAVGTAGGFALPVIGWLVGLSIGLSASGLVTTVQKVGEGTNSLPSFAKRSVSLPAVSQPQYPVYNAPQATPAPVQPIAPAAPAVPPAPVAPTQPAQPAATAGEMPAGYIPAQEAPINPNTPPQV